jgi:hypothetical protein
VAHVRPAPRFYLFLAGALLAAVICTVARADTVLLRDGTRQEGEIILETEHSVTLRVRMGGIRGTVVIPKTEIVSIARKALPPDTVIADARRLEQEALAVEQFAETVQLAPKNPAARRDAFRKAADAWVRAGEFYQRHRGYGAQANNMYERALLCDPDHVVARAKLQYVQTEDGWARPEAEAASAPVIGKPEAKAPEADLTIGLRRDAEAVNRLLADQQARQEQQRRDSQRTPGNYIRPLYYIPAYGNGLYYNSWGANGDFLYVLPSPAYGWPTYTYPYASFPHGSWGPRHYGGYSGYGGGYGCGSYGGWGLGFSGSWGSVRYNGWIGGNRSTSRNVQTIRF